MGSPSAARFSSFRDSRDKKCQKGIKRGSVTPQPGEKSELASRDEAGLGTTTGADMHPKSAFIYATVLEGAIRTSVNNGPVVTYRAGQNFSEMPGDRQRW